MFQYSEKLRKECIAFYREECNFNIDHETADIYLESLATFYECMESMASKD